MVNFLQKYFKKGITSILILSIFTSALLPLTTIYAQVSGGYNIGGGYPTGQGITGGIGANISALTPLLAELPLCADKIGVSKVKGLFREASSLLKTKSGADGTNTTINSQNNPLNESFAIEVIDVTLNEKTNTQINETKSINKSTAELNENDTCLKSVGRLVTKMLLQKITVSTVEWINNGFEGKPLFLQDPGKFFGDIAKNEFLQFKLEIDDPTLYPFGRNFLKSRVLGLNRTFSENARYSLNELIKETTPQYDSFSFSTNFSYGGWAAWNALTQVPANNPIGFNMIASTELAVRLKGTSFSKGEEAQKTLDQSGGFLGDERCADPEGLTRAEHNAALVKGEKEMEDYEVFIPGDADNEGQTITKQRPTGNIIGICKKWEYVTPGKLIAESATKLIGYPDNNILEADDLNSAIAAIMDALLNRWTADIANKGFANFDTEGANGSFIYDDDNRTTGAYGQVEIDFPKSFTNSSWLRENPDFNIRTDLTQALIDEQRIYQQRLEEENEVLSDLIATVRQLDYCIPGPHPGWEDDAERYLANEMRKIPVKTPDDMEEWNDGDIATAVSGIADTFSLGLFSSVKGLVESITGENKYQRLSKYYAIIIASSTGIKLDKKDTKISNKYDVVSAFDIIFSRYIKLIKKYYSKDFLPTITPQARIEFRKIAGYEKKIDNNEYAIYTLTGIINRLSKLKDKLDELDPESTEYETYLPMINEFGRLSASMVTGNDIAKLIDDVKEESDQIKYVYNDLLTGPYGCEAELAKTELKNDPTDLLRKTLRTTYPFPILYDYNKIAPPGETPDAGKIPNISNANETQQSLSANELGVRILQKYNVNPDPNNIMPDYHPGPFIDEFIFSKTPYQVTIPASPLFPSKTITVNANTDQYKDPNSAKSNAYGPGFLSAVSYDFETEGEVAVDCRDYGKEIVLSNYIKGNNSVLDCLKITDIFIGVNRWPVTVGRKQGSTITGQTQDNGVIINRNWFYSFEQLIGIY